MRGHERPLSPHLQIYRPQMTSVFSIVHRMTGVVLAVGTIVLVYWLAAAASGPAAFDLAQSIIGSFFGRLFLLGWTFSLFFHFCNGIRHLAWDAGWGFELEQVHRTGLLVIAASAVLTLAVWIAGYWMMGGG